VQKRNWTNWSVNSTLWIWFFCASDYLDEF
jgi:hypothetical protein